jgi:hypothetical protein
MVGYKKYNVIATSLCHEDKFQRQFITVIFTISLCNKSGCDTMQFVGQVLRNEATQKPAFFTATAVTVLYSTSVYFNFKYTANKQQRCHKSTGKRYFRILDIELLLLFILRPTVSRPVRLSGGPSFGAHDLIFILLLLI